jgi:phosphotransferase system enzyme I (PtsI)
MASNPDLFPKEDNPFMGYRAIRFCLDNKDIFKDQLRAVLMASQPRQGEAHVPDDQRLPRRWSARTRSWRSARPSCAPRAVLRRGDGGGRDDRDSERGGHVDLLEKQCDFFSVGTNDLIQYMLAIDRGNDRIAHLYEPSHPAVLRTLKRIVDDSHRLNVPVGVCGEMAGDPVYAALLLGLGVDSLSMAPPSSPPSSSSSGR